MHKSSAKAAAKIYKDVVCAVLALRKDAEVCPNVWIRQYLKF